MTLQEALQLDAAAFWKNAEIILAIQSVLKPPPWSHQTISTDAFNHSPCLRCGEVLWMGDRAIDIIELAHPDCPVPPPLEEEPEVVARTLRDLCVRDYPRQMAVAVVSIWSTNYRGQRVENSSDWYAFWATPEQQIICCLLALGQITTEKEI